MDRNQAIILAKKLALREQTAAELQTIHHFLSTASRSDAEAFMDEYHAMLQLNGEYSKLDRQLLERLHRLNLDQDAEANNEKEFTGVIHRIHFLRTAWFKYAAAILVILLSAAYLWNTQNKKETPSLVQTDQSVPVNNDVLPGSDKAILTLSNGNKIELSATGGKTIKDGNLTIQNQEGALKYGKTEVVVFNTMSTPKGGQYELILPDRTHVWLNAASSITYPTAFTEKTREVTVTGECYFEVAKDRKKPFIVKTSKEDVRVLGTQFNVNAYADEAAMKTSLLEGAVRIGTTILKPGQAYVNGQVVVTDVQQDVAWKNGVFNFNRTSLQEAMRQLSRWYDIEVVYKDNIPAFNFYGEMQRTLTLSQVLNGLADLGVTFTIEKNKRLVVAKDVKTRLTK